MLRYFFLIFVALFHNLSYGKNYSSRLDTNCVVTDSTCAYKVDSANLIIMKKSNVIHVYRIEGIQAARSRQNKNYAYVGGFKVKSKGKLGPKNMKALKSFFFDCKNYPYTVSKCTFTTKYCISFVSGKKRVEFFVGANAGCPNANVIENLNKKSEKEYEVSSSILTILSNKQPQYPRTQ